MVEKLNLQVWWRLQVRKGFNSNKMVNLKTGSTLLESSVLFGPLIFLSLLMPGEELGPQPGARVPHLPRYGRWHGDGHVTLDENSDHPQSSQSLADVSDC